MAGFRSLITLFLIQLPFYLTGEVINQPVVNIYLNPEEDTEVDSQAIYGSSIKVIEKKEDGWIKIRTRDGVANWVKAAQVTTSPSFERSDKLRPVKNLFAHVYRVTDTTPFPPLMTLPFGALVKLEDTSYDENRWVRVELVSGAKAWMQRADIDFDSKQKSPGEISSFSKKFIGLPYTWGGSSSFGFDCSGFVQMLYEEIGVILPRNAKDQALSPLLFTVDKTNLLPGDLVFFGPIGSNKITHVGVYLGKDEFIHADSGRLETPVIHISSLSSVIHQVDFIVAKRPSSY